MTQPNRDRRPPRPDAQYRWTQPKALAFIEALARHGKVATAARAVGMTRQSAYRLRDRVPQVAEVWARAQAIGRERRRGKFTVSRSQGDGFAGQGDGSGRKATLFAPKATDSGELLWTASTCQLDAAKTGADDGRPSSGRR